MGWDSNDDEPESPKNPEVVCSSLTTRTRRPTRRAVRKRRRLQQKALLVGVYLALTAKEKRNHKASQSQRKLPAVVFLDRTATTTMVACSEPMINQQQATQRRLGMQNKTSGGGLFGSDDESDDDIFGTGEKTKADSGASQATANATASKGGLFADSEEDEDDIFGTGSVAKTEEPKVQDKKRTQ